MNFCWSSSIVSKRKYLIVGEPRVIFFENKSKFTLKNHSLPKFLIFLSWREWKLSGKIFGGIYDSIVLLLKNSGVFQNLTWTSILKNTKSLLKIIQVWPFRSFDVSSFKTNLKIFFWILYRWLHSFLLRVIIEIGRETCVIFFENKSKFTFKNVHIFDSHTFVTIWFDPYRKIIVRIFHTYKRWN